MNFPRHIKHTILITSLCTIGLTSFAQAQSLDILQGSALKQDDFVVTMVRQLELEKYKATIKSLTEFGDRRQGTERNRRALDWIEAQLKSYGCTNTERMQFDYTQAPPGAALN